MLHRRFAQDQEFVERFRREASAAAGLQHPNVVGVFDRGEHDGTYYIAMEHLPGRTLKEIVTAEAPLPQEQVVDLGIQILQAAGFAHRHGVIHRDFKPHNVIVDEHGGAKVTDFGIARAGASEMTETGSIMGTAQYLSPEQAQGHAVTAASDLYSIGVMLYEMLAGRLPFEGDSAVSIALKHLSEPPAPISQLRPDVNPAVESVVMAALAKDPAHRWQTADDFAEALQAAGAQLGQAQPAPQDTAAFAPVPAPVVPPPPPRRPSDERRRRWPLFTIGVLTLLLAAFLAYLAIAGLTSTETKEVPRVVGKQLLQARQILERDGFEVEESRVRSEAPFDQVVDQDPNPRVEADEGSTVTLEVSGGPGDGARADGARATPGGGDRDARRSADLKATVDSRPVGVDREGDRHPHRAGGRRGRRPRRARPAVRQLGARAGRGARRDRAVARLRREPADRRRAGGGDPGARVGGARGRRDLAGSGGRVAGGPRRDRDDHGLDRHREGERAERGRTEPRATR